MPFTVSNGVDADGIGGGTVDRPNFNPNGQRGVRAVPVVAPATIPNPSGTGTIPNPNFGRITGYVNPDAGNAPIDPNTAQFIANPTFIAGNPFESGIPRVGTLGRNTERTPGIENFDFNILKRTRISESTYIEFRTEFFNLFNHPQFGIGSVSPFSPPGNPAAANFIGTNTTGSVAGVFLQPNTQLSDGGGRVIRYQVKLVF